MSVAKGVSRHLDVEGGEDVRDTISRAIAFSEKYRVSADFQHNGVWVSVVGHSNPDVVFKAWERATKGEIPEFIGPFPEEMLERNNEGKISEAEIEERERATVENVLSDAPELELKDPEKWREWSEHPNPGMRDAAEFAARWGRVMQAEMNNGAPLYVAAAKYERKANFEGLSGSQFGAAVSALGQCWKHGLKLRKWHERQHGSQAPVHEDKQQPTSAELAEPTTTSGTTKWDLISRLFPGRKPEHSNPRTPGTNSGQTQAPTPKF